MTFSFWFDNGKNCRLPNTSLYVNSMRGDGLCSHKKLKSDAARNGFDITRDLH